MRQSPGGNSRITIKPPVGELFFRNPAIAVWFQFEHHWRGSVMRSVMPLASRANQKALATFIASLTDVRWIANTGDRDDATIVADDLLDACEGWNSEMLAAWKPETTHLEQVAVAQLGETELDAIFEAVSHAVDTPLRAAMDRYFDTRSTDKTNANRGLWPEWLDTMKRDMCWAAVEAVLGRPGFFTGLLDYYRAGRWPCAWEDGDRGKRVVVL